MRTSRHVSATGEPSPFSSSEDFYKDVDNPPAAGPPRLDLQPSHRVRRRNGRPVILETCMRCGTKGECTDDGEDVICEECG